jgi:NAD(P)-dependent dehydrogenase (short-subunit alcohol dehydrogenase family)
MFGWLPRTASSASNEPVSRPAPTAARFCGFAALRADREHEDVSPHPVVCCATPHGRLGGAAESARERIRRRRESEQTVCWSYRTHSVGRRPLDLVREEAPVGPRTGSQAGEGRDGLVAGRVAVVTGAAHGLGAASARRLAEEGASVVVVDVDGPGARAVAESLPVPAIGVEADVADEADVARYLDAAVAAFGRVDLHHLNAGVFGTFDRLPEIGVDDFRRVLDVNVVGQFLGVRAAFRQYSAQGSGGAIVLTASIASLTGSADLLPYQTSKHATLGLLRGAAVYGGPLGVRVNAVAPGIVPTNLFGAAADAVGGKNDMEQRASTTPLRRAGTPEEIADVALFLLSDAASYVTGQALAADGGASIVNSVRPSGGAGAWDPEAIDDVIYGSRSGGQR